MAEPEPDRTLASLITPTQTGKTYEGGNDNKKDDESSEDNDSCDDCSAITAEALCKLLGVIKQVSPITHNYLDY